MSSSKVLFQLSGSIAAYKACEVISSLVKKGCEVQCVATQSALQFVGKTTLEGLTGRPVFSDVFEEGHCMDHISLERWADLIILCPATATSINRLASGLASDAISTLFLAHQFNKPYLLAPAMNQAMYQHPTTQDSLKKLSSWGLQVIQPESGSLACGETGEGRLASPQHILESIDQALASHLVSSHKVMSSKKNSSKILVTYGGTEEPIDGVRTLSNFSSGQTGAQIVDYLRSQGHSVTALASYRAVSTKTSGEKQTFKSFYDLDSLLRKNLEESSFDSIIHLAAVSDFSVESIDINGAKKQNSNEKMKSSDQVSIHLKPNFKIVDRLKKYSINPNIKVIAFKLTQTKSNERRAEQIEKLLSSPAVDWVVHNELNDINETHHPFTIYNSTEVISSGKNKNELAIALEKIIIEKNISLFSERSPNGTLS